MGQYGSYSPLYGEGGGRGEGEKMKMSFISQHPGLSEGRNVPCKEAKCLDIHGEAFDLGGGGGLSLSQTIQGQPLQSMKN